MCGIAGIVSLGAPVEDDAPRIAAMCEALAHRGPDDQGFYQAESIWLGHRRLSIIDLEGGHQPMSNEDGTVWITYGGEVFNFRELRRDLERRGHTFRTASDTEVIVHLYEEHGTDCFGQLNGQFALAVWDQRRRELILARDLWGITPLYYAQAAGRLLFASEVKGLLATGWVDARMDLKGLAQIATFGAVLAPRTMFEGVEALEPGCWMRVRPRSGRVERRRYADIRFPPAGEHRRKPEAYWRERLRWELGRAVRRRLVADVPIGLYLSGGIDSSAVGALMLEHGGAAPRAFGVGFEDASLDESGHAAAMAQNLGAPYTRVHFDDALLNDTLAPLVRSAEAPMFSLEPAPLWRLAEATSRDRHVVLSGQGADEMFGGYPYVNIARFRDALTKAPWSVLRDVMSWFERWRAGVNCAFPNDAARRRVRRAFGFEPGLQIVFAALEQMQGLFSDEVREVLRGYSAYDDMPFHAKDTQGWDPFDRSMYVAYKTNLANYLLSVQGDRPAMAHAVEVRFPFLDPDFVDFCATIPPELRHRRGCEKYILREAVRGLVPEPIRRRRKQPFMASWGVGLLGEEAGSIGALLSRETTRCKGYFDPDAVEQLTGEVRALAGAGRPLDSFAAMALNRRFQRLCLRGMGVNLVATAHLWDEVFRGSSARVEKFLPGMHRRVHVQSRGLTTARDAT